jgi:hypothetical protein
MAFTLQDLLDLLLPAISTDGISEIAKTYFSRPLTPEEVELYNSVASPVKYKENKAKDNVLLIPDWATWTEAEIIAWWDANLSAAQVATVVNIVTTQAMMTKQNKAIKDLARLIVNLRDGTWPDLS